ncbi:MAG: HAMP domain-containing protein [Thermoguttaceae bacterium]|nr:HAMP domain-containing protein [Thermoguttaceae bacterium]
MPQKKSPEKSAAVRFGSSLEVKCLFFFGLALAAVIIVSFVLYYKLTARQLDSQNPLTGKLLAEREFILWHFDAVLRQSSPSSPYPERQPDTEDYDTSDFIDNMKYQSERLGVEGRSDGKSRETARLIRTSGPRKTPEDQLDPFEIELIDRLTRATDDSAPTSRTDDEGNYIYYQPLRIETSCINCHPQEDHRSSLGLGSLQGLIRVELSDPPSKKQITRFWAMLLAAAIVTAFVGLVSFYTMIRMIIIKPLRQLREVSEAISHGDITMRAQLETGDEFEALGTAFNRMMQHLISMQDELRETNAELRDKVDELATQSLKLFETNKIKSDFMATMSHELRTPLNSILGFSEVLGSIDTLSDKQRRYVENINNSGQTLLNMINDILDMARLEAGRLEASPSRFHIAAIVDAQVDMARPLVDKKNLSLLCNIPAGLPQMYQDANRIGQILNNLLSNAIKFTPEGGQISVDVRCFMGVVEGAKGEPAREIGESDAASEAEPIPLLEIRVTDSGVGISPEDRQIIFEKFRQAGSTVDATITREYSGSGLGLSIVKELCRLLEGDVTVESRLGFGSVFTVRVPWEFRAPNLQQSSILSDLREFSKIRPEGRKPEK